MPTELAKPSYIFPEYEKIGADEKTRTSTAFTATATSTLRVYQFRHVRTLVSK